MKNTIDGRLEFEILKHTKAEAGRIGGKRGKGKAKRRSKAHYKRMNEIRWGKKPA